VHLKIFFKSYPETSKCPSCGKVGSIRRSRAKSTFEWIVKYSGVVNYYKCKECGWRGMLKKYLVNRYSFITVVFYVLLVIIVVYVITTVLKKNFGT
jgi:hypothetical protein